MPFISEQIVTMGTSCPAGLFPERCSCVKHNCAGAKFEGDTCVTESGDVRLSFWFFLFEAHFFF